MATKAPVVRPGLAIYLQVQETNLRRHGLPGREATVTMHDLETLRKTESGETPESKE